MWRVLLWSGIYIVLAACQHDFPSVRQVQEVKFARPLHESIPQNFPPVPLPPKKPEALKTLVSATIFPTTPLQDVLWDLAAQAKVNIALGKGVEGAITLTIYQRPFEEVLEVINELAGLRYTIEGESVIIEKDIPYIKSYPVHTLNLQRQVQDRLTISSDLLAVAGRTSGQESGAHYAISGTSDANFWEELRANLEQLLPPAAGNFQEGKGARFTFHRQGGLVTLYATAREHRLVEKFLNRLQESVGAQVLIEAKIIEVTLRDEWRSGINWQGISGMLQAEMAFGQTIHTQPNLATFRIHTQNLDAVLSFLESFGKTRTLSSPRLTVVNNQAAVLKVAENNVYFRLKYNRVIRNKESGGDVVLTSSDIQTVPIGFILVVQPSINTTTGEVTLALRPTITSSTRMVSDPAVNIASHNTVESGVPIVEVREIDSVLHMKDGEIMVLGGLMQERYSDNSSGLPGLRRVPLAGVFFRGDARTLDVVELVIFLKATILKPHHRFFAFQSGRGDGE